MFMKTTLRSNSSFSASVKQFRMALLVSLLGVLSSSFSKAQNPAPSFCDNQVYIWGSTANPASVNPTTGTYTVPSGGPYLIRIVAAGAQGGNAGTGVGGYGAVMQGDFVVNSGTVINITAGSPGGAGVVSGSGAGGGGGSGAYFQNTYIIAGGGGGAGSNVSGYPGLTGPDGGTPPIGGVSTSPGGTGGNGASGYCSSQSSEGGGGLLSAGCGNTSYGFPGIGASYSGYNSGGGGVGPGGAGKPYFGSGVDAGGGGGGGFSGGGGGHIYPADGGGGGGSINNGANQVNSAGGNAGGGFVTIQCLGALPQTTTSISSNLNPSFTTSPNNSVTFTATITSGGNPVTTGTVTFTNGATILASSVPLNGSGQATATTSSLPEGNNNITATYNGASSYATSNGSTTQIVNNRTSVNGNQFCNTGAITLSPSNSSNPYPSNIFVTGLSGNIQTVTVNLNSITASNPSEIALLLVGPGGQNMVILSGAGGTGAVTIPVSLTLSDAGANPVSSLANAIFRPTAVTSATSFPSTAPAVSGAAAPIGTASLNSVFSGINPNGTWSLYAIDHGTGNATIQGGWCLNLTLNPPIVTSVTPPSGQQGATNLSVAIVGQYTHFVHGTSNAAFGAGITVNSLTVTDATHATASITIEQAATVGSSNVTVTTGTEVATLTNGFSVTAGPLAITNVSVTLPTCDNLSAASVVVSASGGAGPLQYSFDGGTTWSSSNTLSASTTPAISLPAVLSILVKDINFQQVSYGNNPVLIHVPTCCTNPALNTVPVCQNNLATLTASATGESPSLTYQWYSNTANSNSNGTAISSTPVYVANTTPGSTTVSNVNVSYVTTTQGFSPPTALVGTTYYYYTATGPGGSVTCNVAGQVVVNPLQIIVTNNNDAGPGSLRQAMLSACPGSTITFDPTFFATPQVITLASDLPHITQALTITGPGADFLTLNGNNFSMFLIAYTASNPTISVNFSGLTLSGTTGNCLNSSGQSTTLNISNCKFSNITSPLLIFSGGALNLSGCAFTNNLNPSSAGQGTIYVNGPLTVTGCSFTNNSENNQGEVIACYGGGAITNSTFSGNHAYQGGGIFVGGTSTTNTTTISNCTFYGNISSWQGGAIYVIGSGATTVTNCTIAGNTAVIGGGIAAYGGTLNVSNTICAGNTSPSGPDVFIAASPFTPQVTSLGNNLIGKTDGSSGWIGTDLTGSIASPINPLLDPNGLQNNGGPTQTVALLPGSPAINAGNNALAVDQNNQPLTTDQRGAGFPRISPSNGTVDIGAFEFQCINNPVVTNNNDAGPGSLRQAVLTACPGSTITFSGVTGTITLTTGQITISQNLIINGPGASALSVSGGGASRVFNVTGGTVNINNLTVTGGFISNISHGAGIDNFGNLTVDHSIITLNSTCKTCGLYGEGGGIYNESAGILTLTNSTISYNSATNGGGIENDGTLNASNTTFFADTALYGFGGGLHTRSWIQGQANIATLTNCSFYGNTSNFGGGIVYQGTLLNLTNCTISNNSTTGGPGGGIDNNGGGINVFNCQNTIIAGNSAGSASNGPDVNNIVVTSLGNNLIGKTDGSSGWIGSDLTGTVATPLNPLLDPNGLANNGGPTQTIALLPGSPAINAGTSSGVPSADQRGSGRVNQVDIGAFESQGFTLSVDGGNNQTTQINTAFSSPLSVRVSSSAGEPVSGGIITFTVPINGASATIGGGNLVSIAGNTAITGTVTANGIFGGPYAVTASASGTSTPVSFNLTNGLPTISVTASLANFTACAGSASSEQTFTVSAINLTGNAVITAPAGFELSLTPGTGYSGSISLPPVSGTVSSTLIYVRMTSGAAGSPSGNIACTASGATEQDILISGTVNPLPGAPASGGDQTQCALSPLQTLTAAATGGTITWYDALTGGNIVSSPTLSALGTVTYYAEASSGSCTSLSRTAVTLTIKPLPSVAPISYSGSTTVCSGALVTLSDATAGGSWSASSLAASVTSAGTVTFGNVTATTGVTIYYTVTANGCSTTVGVPFTISPPLSVASITGNGTICGIGGTTAFNDATGGGSWSSSNTAVATVNSTGLVTGVSTGTALISYTVNSGGCTATVNAGVAVYALPTAFTVTGGGAFCSPGTGVAVGLSGSQSGVRYQLLKGGLATGSAVPGTGAAISFGNQGVSGSYTVTASNTTSGCTAPMTGSAAVTANAYPNATITATPPSVCSGSTGNNAAVASGATSYNWSISNGTIIGSKTASTITYTAAMYDSDGDLEPDHDADDSVKLTLTVITNGCSATGTKEVLINALPTVAAISGNSTLIRGLTTAFSDATAGGTWSSSNTSIALVSSTGVVTGVAAGSAVITYKVTNTAGCSTAVTRTITVYNPLTATVKTGTISCNGGTTTLTVTASGGSGGYQYSLNGGKSQSGSSFTLAAGTFSIKVADNAGDTYSVSGLSISQPAAIVVTRVSETNASTKTSTNGSFTVKATGGTGAYLYSDNSGSSYQSSATFTGLAARTYTVYVKDANGCIGKLSVTVGYGSQVVATITDAVASETPETGDISNATIEMILAPNPSVGSFNLELKSGLRQQVEIQVMDLMGHALYHTRGDATGSYRFGGNFIKGIYFVEILYPGGIKTLKAIKQ